MRLKAIVKKTTGKTMHLRHPTGPQAAPAWVEVEPQADGTYLLLYMDANGMQQTDTWHASLVEAKRQAAFEFEIGESDWVEVADC
jgi:hypothetical protein